MKVLLKTSLYLIFILLIGSGLLAMFYYYYRDNFHVLLPGKYFRSAQLDSAEFVRTVEENHIQSIIDLQLREQDPLDYQREKTISDAYQLNFYYFPMLAYQLPTPSQLNALVELIQKAPQPVLIHCGGGADRTGLASTFVLLLNDYPLEVARQQISSRYFVISSHSVGRLVLPYYAHWLKTKGLHSNRQHFLTWLQQENFDL